MAKNSNVRASDWEGVGVAQVGGAEIWGGGSYLFSFRSQNANYRAHYLLAGGGVGLGGSLGGSTAIDPSSTDGLSWSPVPCAQAFSAADLNLSLGSILTFG